MSMYLKEITGDLINLCKKIRTTKSTEKTKQNKTNMPPLPSSSSSSTNNNISLYSTFSPFGAFLFLLTLGLSFGLKVMGLSTTSSKIFAIAEFRYKEAKLLQLAHTHIKTYSFENSITDSYNSSAYALLILLLVSTAIIPLIHHLIVFCAFCLPMTRLPRIRSLRFCNMVGRLGLTDILFSSINQLVLYHKLDYHVTPRLYGVTEVFCIPKNAESFGLACLFIITVLTNILLYIDEKNCWERRQQDSNNNYYYEFDVLSTLLPITISNNTYGTDTRYRLFFRLQNNRMVQFLLGITSVGCFVLYPLLVGWKDSNTIVSFKIDQGAIGHLLQEMDPGWTHIDLLTIPQTLGHVTERANIGSVAMFVMVSYVLTMIVFPVLLLGCITIVLVGNLSWEERSAFRMMISNVLSPLCSLDVLAITCIFSYLELYHVIEYPFEQRFPKICELVQRVRHVKCIGLTSEIHGQGLAILICTSVCFFILEKVLLRTVGSSLK
jgi:hypothetical protein